MSLSCTGDLNITASISETLANAFGGGKFPTTLGNDFQFSAGTGPNAINSYLPISATAAASPTTYTLSSLTDGLGRTVTFTKIRGFLLWIPSGTNGQDLTVRWPVVSPGSAPTCAHTGSDASIPAGNYLVSYTFCNQYGETTRSADSSTVAVGSTEHITVTLPALPTGATGINVYLTTTGGASNTATRQNLLPITTTTYTILSLQTGPAFPSTNTCAYRGWVGIPPLGDTVRASGILVRCSPLTAADPVTSTSADQIVIDPGANTITYKMLAFGEA